MILSLCLLFAAPPTYGDVVVSRVTSIYDGDTFTVEVDEWPEIIRRVPVRIIGIDCPELRDNRPAIKEKAREAKVFTVTKLRAAKKITLRDMGRDKYFRIVTKVEVDGEDLGKLLIDAGHAKPYDGGKKATWP
jgi:micrococcal nuclease